MFEPVSFKMSADFWSDQCDQMARLFSILGHLQQCKLAQKHTNFTKDCWFFSNTKLSFEKLPKDLQSFAKVAKFRQIWSRCFW